MAEQSGFFPDVSGDRQYTADFLAQWIASVIGNGVYNGDLAVTAGGNMQIHVPSGRAWINGYHYRNDGALLLSVANADGVLNRKDTVVLRWDINARSITAQILQGTPASSPTAPAIARTAEQYDLKLAEISIPAGTTAITQSLIMDTRLDKAVCGIVTGVVQQVDTTTFYNQIIANLAEFKNSNEAGFTAWFAGIKDILDESAAGNLLNLISTHKADEAVHMTSLACTKSGTVYALTGLAATSGIIHCAFQAPEAYVAGDTFTVNGAAYSVVTSGGEALRSVAFLSGDIVGIHLDVSAQKLYIRQDSADQTGSLAKSRLVINVYSDRTMAATESGAQVGIQAACNVTLPTSSSKVQYDFHTNAAFTLRTPSGTIYDSIRLVSGTSISIPKNMHFNISSDGGNWLIDKSNDAFHASNADSALTVLLTSDPSAHMEFNYDPGIGVVYGKAINSGGANVDSVVYGALCAIPGSVPLTSPGLRNQTTTTASPSGGSEGDSWDVVGS